MRRRHRIIKMEIDRESKLKGRSAAVLRRRKTKVQKNELVF